MRVLVICDDVWHPAEVVKLGMEELDAGEFQFDYVMDARDILTPNMLKRYPVIINCKANVITSANAAPWFSSTTEVGPAEFREYVEQGGGFLSVHSGNSFRYDECPDFVDFVGNAFVGHPPRCAVTVRPVKEHPITKDVSTFICRDEHYQLDHLADDIDVFLESDSEAGGTQVCGYTRTMGEGRLAALMPGHILSVWQHPEFVKLLSNAIRWCAKLS